MTATITGSRAELSRALTKIAAVQGRRSPKPALVNTVFDANGSLTATAHDGCMEFSARIELQGIDYSGESTIAVDVHALKKALPKKGNASIVLNGRSVDCAGVSIPAFDLEEIPSFPNSRENAVASVFCNVAPLRLALQQVQCAQDCESSRYALGGVCLDFERLGENRAGGQLHLIASDGRRLHVAHIDASMPNDDGDIESQVIIPAAAVKALLKILPKTGVVEIVVFANQVLIIADGMEFYSRLVEGRFPKWQDVIPADPVAAGCIGAKELLAVCDSLKSIANDETRGLDLKFSGESLFCLYRNNGSRLATRIPAWNCRESNRKADRLAYHAKHGYFPAGSEFVDDRKITLDYTYLADNLKAHIAAGVEWLEFAYSGCESAALVTSDFDSLQVVVMPLSRDRR